MRRFFGRIENEEAIVEGDEYVHLHSVLRARIGDEIVVYNGSENEYFCKIKVLNKNYALCDVYDVKKCSGLPKKNIMLFQALTKRDKMEIVLQKAVELGITKLIPFESEFCTVKPSENKRDRLEKLVISACKQCERSVPMEIGECIKFDKLEKQIEDFLKKENSIVLFANERDGNAFDFSILKKMKNIAIIVGSEGGFAEKEKERLCKLCESVSLGERILRSETASIVLCGMASVIGEN